MSSVDSPEVRLQQSWRTNAAVWTAAVRDGQIPSRRAGTDAAVCSAVLSANPKRVLDVGCGEGWLARALTAHGCQVIGVDASPELIASARALGGGRFEVMSYAELGSTAHTLGGPFDVAVCNFSLLGEDITFVLRAIGDFIRWNGWLVIQTVHPWMACGDAPYVDGWRIETFEGFGGQFPAAMPWYFRTAGSWWRTIIESGFTVERWEEPLDPISLRPLSLVMRCGPSGLRYSDQDGAENPAKARRSRPSQPLMPS
jgi:2-polyprenyl-3-methyl-5-hydroxy-6-metoxy-1,4-benzoquinol methylase